MQALFLSNVLKAVKYFNFLMLFNKNIGLALDFCFLICYNIYVCD